MYIYDLKSIAFKIIKIISRLFLLRNKSDHLTSRMLFGSHILLNVLQLDFWKEVYLKMTYNHTSVYKYFDHTKKTQEQKFCCFTCSMFNNIGSMYSFVETTNKKVTRKSGYFHHLFIFLLSKTFKNVYRILFVQTDWNRNSLFNLKK